VIFSPDTPPDTGVGTILLRPRKESRRKECIIDDASRNLRGFSQTSPRAKCDMKGLFMPQARKAVVCRLAR
jgi:hypothetical protein